LRTLKIAAPLKLVLPARTVLWAAATIITHRRRAKNVTRKWCTVEATDHPTNRGTLCPRLFVAQEIMNDRRLLKPQCGGRVAPKAGHFVDDAINESAARVKKNAR